jgi:hypothetical protein
MVGIRLDCSSGKLIQEKIKINVGEKRPDAPEKVAEDVS